MNIIILILFSIFQKISLEKNIRLAINLYKHGVSSPKNLTKENKDIFGENWENKDELTAVGLRQEYLIGYINYIRYIKKLSFLNENYDPRETLFYSINSNKSIVSSYAQSQGFFYPNTGLILTEKQKENGVPPINDSFYIEEKKKLDVNALPEKINIAPTVVLYENDFLINALDNNLCEGRKKYLNKWSENMNNQKKKINDKYSKIISDLLNEKQETLFNDYLKSKNIFDTILSEYYDGKNMEKFKKNGTNETELIKDILDFYQFDYENENNDNVENTIGPFIRWIISLCDSRIKKDKEGKEIELDYKLPKFIGISLDDTIIKPFQFIMKMVFNASIEYADFGSYLNLDLYNINHNTGSKIKDEDYLFEYNFNGNYKLSIPYPDFKKKLNEKLKSDDDVKKYCNFKDSSKRPFYKDIYCILSIVLTIFFIILGFLLIKKRKGEKIKAGELEPILEM